MNLFDEKNNKKYSCEILMDAYKHIEWYKNDEGEYNFPDGDFFYVRFESPKEESEHFVKKIFSDIYLINSFIQEGTDDTEIAGFIFYKDKILIHNYIKSHNSEFNVEIYYNNDDKKWYCKSKGIEKFANSVCVNDNPNGYPTNKFESKLIEENGGKYILILNS
jgi:hypothetical protein